jgi:hypothetical protein
MPSSKLEDLANIAYSGAIFSTERKYMPRFMAVRWFPRDWVASAHPRHPRQSGAMPHAKNDFFVN